MTAKEELIEDTKNIKSRDRWRALVLVMLSAVLFLTAGIVALLIFNTLQDQAQKGESLARQVREACADPRLNTEEMADICKKADEVIESPAPSNPLRGEQGPPPSDEQVSRAVSRYCATYTCRGADGQDATQSQVRQAVALYCNARGECIGPSGKPGADGKDGVDGAEGAQGVQGPPPSDQQVSNAVANYCSTRNECRGAAGADGKDGKDGSPGRGIASVSCARGSASLTFTYTDGTTETVECTGNNPDEGQ